VVIYSTDKEIPGTAPHVRHREFTRWAEENAPGWLLLDVTRGPNPDADHADLFTYAARRPSLGPPQPTRRYDRR
jgi:hypothetical protein